jgi:hypothetical protein
VTPHGNVAKMSKRGGCINRKMANINDGENEVNRMAVMKNNRGGRRRPS